MKKTIKLLVGIVIILIIVIGIVIVIKNKKFDPYAIENEYNMSDEIFERQDNVEYGTVDSDVEYYSTTAGDYKKMNVLLPPGYSKEKKYPVVYHLHGFGTSYKAHVRENSYMHILYGNLYAKKLVEPMIIVGVDMYTDKQEDKEDKTDEELRFIYDKVIDDIVNDVMPFMESNYSIKTGRENTAISGASQGGSEALATGFKYLDKFAYIAGIAPDPGVIPTEFYKGTFWNVPIFQEFPMPTEENTPKYLYMAVGSNDEYNVDCTLYYGKVLNEMGIKNQTDYVEGYEHDTEFWKRSMYNFLKKIFK